MNRRDPFARFDRDAARRHSDLPLADIRPAVDDWFAAVFGWPLSERETAARDAFLVEIADVMEVES